MKQPLIERLPGKSSFFFAETRTDASPAARTERRNARTADAPLARGGGRLTRR